LIVILEVSKIDCSFYFVGFIKIFIIITWQKPKMCF
jgi:hypothetical protein